MLSTKTNDWCRDVSYLAAHFKTDMTLCKEYIKHCSSSNMKQVYNTNIKYHTTVYKHLCNTQTHTGAVQTSKHHVKRMKWTVIKNWKSIWHWTVKGQNQSAFLTTQDLEVIILHLYILSFTNTKCPATHIHRHIRLKK